MSYSTGGYTYTDHVLTVPLDWDDPVQQIEIYAREIARDDAPDAPALVWFQGGPGNKGQRPESIGGWLEAALGDYRVFLVDQRGTGRSTPADAALLGDLDGAAQGEYLAHLRADAIVRDAEALRESLGLATWTALGQSFGGFIITTYLSMAPAGLEQALITAGLPPLFTADGARASADDVYRSTYPLTAARNAEFFDRYPGDQELAGTIARHLADTEEVLPTGERLTPERFQQLGIGLGTASGFDAVHYLIEDPFTTVRGQRRIKPWVLAAWGAKLTFATNPLYAAIHESIYGTPGLSATNWAAERMRAEFEAFATPPAEAGADFVFVGEHMFSWQFQQDPALVPLRGGAEVLAAKDDWTDLYELAALAENQVPVAAAIYTPDMFVPRSSQERTAAAIRGLVPVYFDEYQHDGIRADGARIFRELQAALVS